jgi:hypothetical protein
MLDFVLVCCSRVSCEFKTLPFKLPWNVPLFMCCLSPARPGGPFKLGWLTDPGKAAFRETSPAEIMQLAFGLFPWSR